MLTKNQYGFICRITKKIRPDHTELWRFKYEPTYSDKECKELLYNYIETDISLKDRIKRRINNVN